MSQKQTPKSCNCTQCRRGKHTKSGHFMMKCDERALRRKVKQMLQTEQFDNIPTVPIGNYYD